MPYNKYKRGRDYELIDLKGYEILYYFYDDCFKVVYASKCLGGEGVMPFKTQVCDI